MAHTGTAGVRTPSEGDRPLNMAPAAKDDSASLFRSGLSPPVTECDELEEPGYVIYGRKADKKQAVNAQTRGCRQDQYTSPLEEEKQCPRTNQVLAIWPQGR